MSYNLQQLPGYVNTAGKVTILTALSGVAVFLIAFFVNAGANGVMTALAQTSGTATTTLTVLNLPPEWTVQAFEDPASATSTPTNSGDDVTWKATATDSNNAPYFLLICEQNIAPTAASATNYSNLGTAPPSCSVGNRMWGVSASTTSGAEASVSTTTTEAAPFGEVNSWYAWVCDDDPVNPRCSVVASSTPNATSTPFHVNSRPTFTDFSNTATTSPYKNPGDLLDFTSASDDSDVVGGADEIFLVVCTASTSYNSTLNDCNPGEFIASTTITAAFTSNATATYQLVTPLQDQAYAAYGFIVDEHGHEAIGAWQGTNTPYIIANVAPTISSISLNNDNTIILDTPAGETAADSYTLTFVASDANTCDAVGGNSYDEMVDFRIGIFRSGISSSTCNANNATTSALAASMHNENNCYVSEYTPWALTCTASSTSCGVYPDETIVFECEFPLWFIADPTDAGTPFASQYWVGAVSSIDDDGATSTYATSSVAVELQSFPAIAMQNEEIAYGSLEPGNNTGTLSASTTIQNEGNTGLDQNLSGHAMCESFTGAVTCPNSSTSTVPDWKQQFASTTGTSYDTDALEGGAGLDANIFQLSSSTIQELELNIQKTTGTTTADLRTGTTWWGIEVPASINATGDYTGLNTFGAVVGDTAEW